MKALGTPSAFIAIRNMTGGAGVSGFSAAAIQMPSMSRLGILFELEAAVIIEDDATMRTIPITTNRLV
jgi:hypothetical protein